MQKITKKQTTRFLRYLKKLHFWVILCPCWPILGQSDISRKIGILSLFKIYGHLTSCKKIRKNKQANSEKSGLGMHKPEFKGPFHYGGLKYW